MTTIVTPRPPLNLFEVVRITADDDSNGTLIYTVPTYQIPAEGPNPQRDVQAAAILTSLLIANTSAGASSASVWVLDKESNQFFLAVSLPVDEDGYIRVDVDKQVLQSTEEIYVQMAAGGTAEVHLSFVLNQREEFTVITE